MNKYQDAIDKVKEDVDWDSVDKYTNEALDVLQELVKWYEAFELIAPDYTKKMIEIYLNKKV